MRYPIFFAVLVLLLLIYTAFVYISSPGDLFGWFNTLISTALSVLFALLVGLVLFEYQTQVTDDKKKEELEELLQTELGEVRRVIGRWRTVVSDAALKTTKNSSTAPEMQYGFHYTHPLIVEEAVRSRLFDTEQTSEMLALARNMRQHNVYVQEAMTLRMEEERARVASGDQFSEEYLMATKRFARALRDVQVSEESIINSCTKLLESLP